MMLVKPIDLDGATAIGMEIKLPKTTLVVAATDKGYIMCGALDVQFLNKHLKERGIIAGRAVGVRNLDDLLAAPLEAVTDHAAALGIHIGMSGRDALKKML